MNANQFERFLRRNHSIQSRTVPATGHKELFNPANNRRSTLPMHGGRKQLNKGLMQKIKKDLGI